MPDIVSTILEQFPYMGNEQKLVSQHVLKAISDPHYWRTNCTKTKDEQDPINPYKPFPDYQYFRDLDAVFDAEPVMMIEKSRTMMASWWAASRGMHWALTHPASRILFVAQDEDRSLILIDYCWTLYEQMEQIFRNIWPLDRPKERQKYNTLELASQATMWALPGKDVQKIRGEHPTIVIFDEAAHIDEFDEAHSNALAARPLKVVALTSAFPGAFRDFTRTAESEEWSYAS